MRLADDQNLKNLLASTLSLVTNNFSTKFTIGGGPHAAKRTPLVSAGTTFLSFSSSINPVNPVHPSFSVLSTEK